MNAPQIIFIVLMSVALGISLIKHGQPKEGTHSIWITLTSIVLEVSLVYWGGFFDGVLS